MHCSHKQKVVFVAIPKTATRSIIAYMEQYLDAKQIHRNTHHDTIPANLKNYFSFTVVRDPYDRMVSYWWSLHRKNNRNSTYTFEAFLDNPKHTRHNGHQSPYIKKNKFDKIIRYEKLEEEFKTLPFYIEGTSLIWANATVFDRPNKNYVARPSSEELLTPEIKAKIAKIYKNDFELLGYPI